MVETAFARSPGYLRLLGLSALVGVLSAVSVLAFLGVEHLMHSIIWGDRPVPTAWLSGSLFAVAVVLVASVLVGWLRHRWDLSDVDPNFVDEMIEGEVAPGHAARFAALGMVTLIGGGSVGPEAPLGTLGAGIGTGVAAKTKGSREDTEDLTFSGISAVFGGLGTFPYVGPVMALEVHDEKWATSHKRLVPGLVAATSALVVLYPFAGTPFLNVYSVGEADFNVLWIPVGILLGAVGAVVGVVAALALGLAAKLRKHVPNGVARAVIAGVLIAAIGFALPLTMFSGREELEPVLEQGAELGLWLLAVVVVAKLFVFALSMKWGFFGGPIFPLIFVGAVLGVMLNALVPAIPIAIAVPALASAVSAALVPLPLMVIILSSMLFGLTIELSVVPAVSAVTAYVLVHGTGVLGVLSRKMNSKSAKK